MLTTTAAPNYAGLATTQDIASLLLAVGEGDQSAWEQIGLRYGKHPRTAYRAEAMLDQIPGPSVGPEQRLPAAETELVPRSLVAELPDVLIVDDHAGFRSLARSLLEASGYVVVGEAADGSSALAAVKAFKPALVLLDVQLPDRDGFAVARELAKNFPAVQIVLISTRDARDYGRRIDESGVRGFIPKGEFCPTALADLLKASRQVDR